jgi:hypothetical protein
MLGIRQISGGLFGNTNNVTLKSDFSTQNNSN